MSATGNEGALATRARRPRRMGRDYQVGYALGVLDQGR